MSSADMQVEQGSALLPSAEEPCAMSAITAAAAKMASPDKIISPADILLAGLVAASMAGNSPFEAFWRNLEALSRMALLLARAHASGFANQLSACLLSCGTPSPLKYSPPIFIEATQLPASAAILYDFIAQSSNRC